jgi:hypothetical protein
MLTKITNRAITFVRLNCSSISHDGSLVAGGFSDSSVKVLLRHIYDFVILCFIVLDFYLNSVVNFQVWDMARINQPGRGC